MIDSQELRPMQDTDQLAQQFVEHRSHLRAVAYRMLGSTSEADDAMQEAWLRLSCSDTHEFESLGGWLTTVISRICMDMLRSRTSRREEPMTEDPPEPITSDADHHTPEHEAIMADSIGDAMLLVLDTLSPAERLAFVLHDTFGIPYDEIATIADRSPAAARQLASRARRRVQGATPRPDPDLERQREVVKAFFDAAHNAEFEALLVLLDPDILVRADRTAAEMGGWQLEGATTVAKAFSGGAQATRLALIDGVPGAVWAPGKKPRVVFAFTIRDGRIAALDLLADPDIIDGAEVAFLDR